MTEKDFEEEKNAPPKITGNGGHGDENGAAEQKTPATIKLKKPMGAEPPKLKLQRPPSERKPVQTPDDPESKAKRETARISLSEAKPVETGAVPAKPVTVPPKAAGSTTEAIKSSTIRIDDIREESLEEIYKAALNATQRVILDDEAKAKTDQLRALTEEKPSKESTIKLQPSFLSKDDDELKNITDQAIKMETARIDDVEEDANRTVALSSLTDAGKSETARIEAPPEEAVSPPSQRKTIRIKRPDGAAAGTPRTISIARAGGATATAPGTGRKLSIKQATGEAAAGEIAEAGGEITLVVSDEKASPVMGSLALVASLLAICVVYVLLATLYEAVPFPGRLIF